MKKVITYGSFDLFHEGHYRLLQRAKALGNYLIVGVTTEHYDESRGKLNVVDSLMERVEHVRQTGLADEIIIEDHIGQKVEDIQKFQIDIFTVGSDWIGAFDYLKQYCEVVYLERTKDVSSTMLRARNFPIIRLGLIGCGRIAVRMVPEVKYVSGIYVEGVYNPHIDSARQFADKCELNFYTDNLEEFFEKVDAVYIASPHGTHYEYARQALLKGKHVLCEKPIVLRQEQAKELYNLAAKQDCVFMEGIKTAYCPGFVQMLAIVKLLGVDYQEVRFDGLKGANGLDIYTKAYLKYPYALATSKTGLGVKSEGQLIISGTRGYIKVTAPWWKTQEFEVCYENTNQNERYFVKFLGDGLRYEISDFVSALNGFEKREYKLTAEESITIAGLLERFLDYKNTKEYSKYL